MTPDAHGDPPRPTHQEILEEEHARINHIIDVLPACQRITEDTHVREIIATILSEAQNTLQYKRQRRRKGSDIPNSLLLIFVS